MDHIAYTTAFWPFEQKHTDNFLAGLGDFLWKNHLSDHKKFDMAHEAAVKKAEEIGKNVPVIGGLFATAVQHTGNLVKGNPFWKEKVVKEVIDPAYNQTSAGKKAKVIKKVMKERTNNAKKEVAKAADIINKASKKTLEAAGRLAAKATTPKRNLPSAQSKRAQGRGSG